VAARTSSLLIDLVKDPKERAVRRREAAVLLSKRGETAEAARLLQQALDERPQDEDALAGLCEVWPALGKESELEKMLRKTLPALPAVEDNNEAIETRARLWERLGQLQASVIRRPR